MSSRGRRLKCILVTGGAGFIGSNFIRTLLGEPDFEGTIVNLDALTYAGNMDNLAGLPADRLAFVHGDIADPAVVAGVFARWPVDTVVHFAAESHVDRSIAGPAAFVQTNVVGTLQLLEGARKAWTNVDGTLRTDTVFHHISTDEVFGSLGDRGYFTETTPYDPRSPYSASKAGSDHLVRAWYHTYGLPVTLSNCSNNYGPWQFPEKLIPLMILKMEQGQSLPVYGDGGNVRDWLHVEDHNRAVWTILKDSPAGESWNIGGENEWTNLALLHELISIFAEMSGRRREDLEALVTFVKDRPGHDRRYAIDCSRIKTRLGWKQKYTFSEGLRQTVAWYRDNREWVDGVQSGSYRQWLDKNCRDRGRRP